MQHLMNGYVVSAILNFKMAAKKHNNYYKFSITEHRDLILVPNHMFSKPRYAIQHIMNGYVVSAILNFKMATKNVKNAFYPIFKFTSKPKNMSSTDMSSISSTQTHRKPHWHRGAFCTISA